MIQRLKSVADLTVKVEDRGPLPHINLESVAAGTRRLRNLEELPEVTASQPGIASVEPGDVLFGKLRPYLAKSWLADRDAYASTELLCLRPRPHVDPGWLSYVVNSHRFVQWAVATSDGAKMPRTSWERLQDFPIEVPPKHTQRVVADYLDRETARIDALVAAKRRLLALLKERTWLAFGARVSRCKSGRPTQLRRVLRSLIDGPFGSSFSSNDYSDSGAAVIRLGNIGFSRYRDTQQAYIPLRLYAVLRAYAVVKGDLLIAGLGDDRNHAGRACVAPDLGPAIVKGKCFRGRVDESRANAEFLALLLSSPLGAEAINMSGRGSTRSMINLELVKSTVVSLPAPADQEAIAAETRSDQAKLSSMTGVLTRQLQLLEERRQALITAAVTGQLDLSKSALAVPA